MKKIIFSICLLAFSVSMFGQPASWKNPFRREVNFKDSTYFTKSVSTVYGDLKNSQVGIYNVLDYGADPTGVVDATSAFQAAIDAIPKTNSGMLIAGLGQGLLKVPKGIYKVNGNIKTNISSLKIQGDGQYATVIETTVDTAHMFRIGWHMDFEVADIGFYHSTVADTSTWSNVLFYLDGTGGGRDFTMNRIHTQGFETILEFRAAINNDNTEADHCAFDNCLTFLKTTSSQSIINEFRSCTWYGQTQRVFDIAGFGNTRISAANVIVDGTFLYLRNINSKFALSSYFELDNVKMEWTAAHNTANKSTRPKFICADGNYVLANISMRGCVLVAGETPWHDARWITYGSQSIIDVQNSYLEGSIELKDIGYVYPSSAVGLSIERSYVQSPDSIIYTLTDTEGPACPNVSFEDCTNGDVNYIFPNITIAKYGKSPYKWGVPTLKPSKTLTISKGNNTTGVLGTDTTYFNVRTYGQPVVVDAVTANIKFYDSGADATSNKDINIYSDAARTALIATIEIPAGSYVATITEYPFTIPPGTIVTEGIFIEVVVGDTGTTFGFVYGTITLKYHSI